MTRFLLALVTASGFCFAFQTAHAEGYGSVAGRFVLRGDVPEFPPLVKQGDPQAKDPSVCGANDVPDESLIVHPETKGIANVAIYLSEAPDDVHPDLKSPPDAPVVFETIGCRFVPHMLHVRAGQQVNERSQDKCAHNLRMTFLENEAIGLTVQPNDRIGIFHGLAVSEPVPTLIRCDIHSYMRAYWLITDHPYAAITDENGNFEIKGLPAGKHKFRVWHEKFGGTGGGYIDRKFTVEVVANEITYAGVTEVDVAKFLE